jgi:type II secretory pathway component PulC
MSSIRPISLVAVTLSVMLLAATQAGFAVASSQNVAEVERVAKRWVKAMSSRDPEAFDLLSLSSQEEFRRVRQLAAGANLAELERLPMVEQLLVLLLRGLAGTEESRSLDDREMFMFALDQGLLGASLRSADELNEVSISSDSARGRLYKFGLDSRPDAGHQYFVRESGRWRVTLEGEYERMQREFSAFVSRTQLPEAEAVFFILEMRLMRKVTMADIGPSVVAVREDAVPEMTAAESAGSALRLVSVRHSMNIDVPAAVTIEDRVESLRYVLEPGDTLPGIRYLRLVEVATDSATFETSSGRTTMHLKREGPPLNQRLRPVLSDGSQPALIDIARLGAQREGMMAQWRNTGLRDRPLLLQQGQLVPVYGAEGEGMRGLRVRARVESSFWHQIGLAPGDLLTVVNGRAIDSMGDWRDLIEIAQEELDITLTLERDATLLTYQTRTIEPR